MKCYVIAGEKSGDRQGASVMQEMRRRRPDIRFFGLGGECMHALEPDGVEDWAAQAAVIGVVEVLCRMRFYLRRLREMTRRIVADKPEMLLFIDYPGFNQRLAERVRKYCPNVKMVWFIAPMVWAWHKSRLPKLARTLDLMLCTFPFEKQHFERVGLRTEFVGHPLADEINGVLRGGAPAREQGLIALFPGSRSREIERHFPIFLKLVQAARTTHPEWHFAVSAASPELQATMQRMARRAGFSPDQLPVTTGTYRSLMQRARVGLVTSGTATLEAALYGLPFALVYRVAWGTYLLGRLLLTIKYIGIVNILAGAPITRELIQYDFTPANCLAELERLMQPGQREKILADAKRAVACLSLQGGAAARAAECALACVEETN